MRILIHMGTSFLENVPNSIRMTTFAQAFVDAGHNVSIISPKYGIDTDEKRIKLITCPMYHPKKSNTLKRLISELTFCINSFFAGLGAGKADVVITTSPPVLISPVGWLLARLKRAALVYDVRDIWPDVALEMGVFKKGSFFERCFRFARNFMTKRADLITTVSPGKVEKLKSYSKKADVLFITNGFDNSFHHRAEHVEVTERYHLNDIFTCVYIGKLGLAQGLTQLLDLAKKAQDSGISARFLLFGSGVEEPLLQKQAADYELENVQFCGRIPNGEIYPILQHAGACYVPLVNENLTDSIPTKLYESLGVGCPVLLSACGDAVDVLNETGLGFSAKPNDIDALWNAFCLMIKKDDWDKERIKAHELMSTAYSRQKVAQYLETEITQRFEHRKDKKYD